MVSFYSDVLPNRRRFIHRHSKITELLEPGTRAAVARLIAEAATHDHISSCSRPSALGAVS